MKITTSILERGNSPLKPRIHELRMSPSIRTTRELKSTSFTKSVIRCVRDGQEKLREIQREIRAVMLERRQREIQEIHVEIAIDIPECVTM